MSGEAKPKPLLLVQLRVLWASACAVVVGGAVSAILFAATTMRSLITEEPSREVESLFEPATPMQMASNVVEIAAMGGLVGLLYGGPAFLLIGLPMHGSLMRHGVVRWWQYALVGAAIAGFFVTLIASGTTGFVNILNPSRWPEILGWTLWYALAGAIATSIFWLIRRPDRDARLTSPANTPT